MNNRGGSFSGGRELAQVSQRDNILGYLLGKMSDAINTLATNAGVSPIGETQAPKAPDAVAVTTGGEMMHISINHSGPVERNIRYFSEISNNPQFSAPLVIDHGTSRTSHPVTLPTKDGSGNIQSYYVRSFAQYPGSQPSTPAVVGGVGSPKAFQMSGSTQMTLLTSTGSGTGANNGQQGGVGLGKVQKRTS